MKKKTSLINDSMNFYYFLKEIKIEKNIFFLSRSLLKFTF